MNFLDKSKKFTYNNNGAREQGDKEIDNKIINVSSKYSLTITWLVNLSWA